MGKAGDAKLLKERNPHKRECHDRSNTKEKMPTSSKGRDVKLKQCEIEILNCAHLRLAGPRFTTMGEPLHLRFMVMGGCEIDMMKPLQTSLLHLKLPRGEFKIHNNGSAVPSLPYTLHSYSNSMFRISRYGATRMLHVDSLF